MPAPRRSRSPGPPRPPPRTSSLAQLAGSTAGDGASSITFWWRRWIEHSRSPSAQTVPCGVGEDLHLDVPGAARVAARRRRVAVAEGRRGLAPGRRRRASARSAGVADDPHAAPAAARRRLDEHGEPSSTPRPSGVAAIGGRTGTPAAAISALGLDLRAHGRDRLGRRADPGQPGVEHGAGEVGVLGQEAVAGVDRVGARPAGRLDDQLGAQVGLGGRGAGQPHRAVGLGDVRRVGVGVGEDGDGARCRARGRCGRPGGRSRRGWRPADVRDHRVCTGSHPEDAEAGAGALDRRATV